MSSNTCPSCGGKLGVKATKCRCGWVMPGAPREVSGPPVQVIACCFQNCTEGAICRVWTATGWANVCRSHYSKVDIVPRRVDSWLVLDVREAYERSPHFMRRQGRTPEETLAREAEMRKRVDAELEALKAKNIDATREPGQDDEDLPLGISRDPLEQEFMDRAQP